MKKFLFFLLVFSIVVNVFEVKTELEYKSKRISKGKVSNPEAVGLVNVKVDSGYGFKIDLKF